jgi:hypothetical protein
MSIESLTEAKNGLLQDVSNRLPVTGRGSLRDDVERIIAIATQLFSAIERQTHLIEEELVIACGEQVRPLARTVFQGRLTRCAESLDTSFQELALNLDRRAVEQHSTQALRDTSNN